jgi:uncharacterized repeat protein (TIGR01451 family)
MGDGSSWGEMVVRKRHVLVVAVVAGLAALGTVVAQQPTNYPQPPGMYSPPPTGLGSRGAQPAGTPTGSTVQAFDKWSPTGGQPGAGLPAPTGGVRPAGGFQPQPGAFNSPPANTGKRLTQPVTAGAGGVRPAGAFDIPPPNMDLPTFKPGTAPPTGAFNSPPAGGRPLPPPSVSLEPESKFPVTNPYPMTDLKPANPVVPPTAPAVQPPAVTPLAPPAVQPPTGGVMAPPLPAVPSVPNVGVPPTGGAGPKPLPAFNPTPTVPPAAPVIPTAPPSVEVVAPPLPGVTPTAPTTAPVAAPPAAALPSRLAPSVSVEAVCPETVVYGQELKYEIVVKNTGSVTVGSVRVEDEIPTGARFVGSDPQAEVNGDRLAWLVGALEAGAERRIAVRVKPTDEGEVRSRATVTFATTVDAKSRVTRPRLAASIVGAEVCRAGEETIFQIKVTNSGSGPATKMMLQARLSDGLVHPQGMIIEAELQNVLPGDTKTVPLKVSASKAGLQWCQISIGADGSPDATAKASVNVVEPVLVVKQTGPSKCLVRAEPVYAIEMSNPGTATTDPVQVTSIVPDGFEYVQASDGGAFNPSNRAVTWSLPALAPGSVRAVQLKLRAAAATDTQLRTIATATPQQPVVQVGAGAVRPAGRVLETKAETAIKAEGVAAIRFEVVDVEDPVEVGKEALYEIRVTNQGTGECTNVQLAAVLAEGTTFTGGNGPTQVKAQGQQLAFEPIQRLAAKGEAVYKVRVRGSVAGDQRFTVQLKCDQVATPVSKEESTKFYKE